MISTKKVITILKKFKTESASKYGIKSLGLFGFFARNQQKETSDVDVFVTLKESDFFVLERILLYTECKRIIIVSIIT